LYLLYERFQKFAEQRWEQPQGKLAGRVLYGFIHRRMRQDSEKSVRHADLVNVPNDAEAECLGSEIDPTLRVLVQPYGLTISRAREFLEHAAPPEVRRRQQRVCFVGMWGPRKGSRDWAAIIAKVRQEFPATPFKFLGTMVDAEKIRSDLGAAAENCEFVSAYQPHELPQLLSDCAVGAFPSYVEGFGLAVIEQLTAALPTVAYDTPGPRDILGSELAHLLVPSGDVERFAAAICHVLRLEEHAYAELSRRSAAVADRFSWPKIAAETLAEYQRGLASNGEADGSR